MAPHDNLNRVKRHQVELGVPFAYQGGVCAKQRDKRLCDGYVRLQRLRQLHRPVPVKAALVQATVWSSALYGLEASLLPESTVQKLRAAAAKAVIGCSQVRSPWLVLSCVTKRCQDPEHYLLSQCLRAHVRLHFHHSALARTCWESAANLQFPMPRRGISGPGAVLRAMLNRNGFTLQPCGLIRSPGMHSLALSVCSPRDVVRFLDAAWQHRLASEINHRNGLQHVYAVDHSATADVFLKLPAWQQALVVPNIVGSFMSQGA